MTTVLVSGLSRFRSGGSTSILSSSGEVEVEEVFSFLVSVVSDELGSIDAVL